MQDLMEFAVDIAHRAGAAAMQHYRSGGLVVDRKGDATPVTVADRHAEALLRDEIARRFPQDAVVGEEQDDTEGTSGRTWYLDPIDGTKSFVHGVPLFTTLVACYDGDGPLVGVIHAAALEETTWAGRGSGAFHDGAPARVSGVVDLADAYVMTSGLEWWPADLRAAGTDGPFTLRTWGDGYGFSLVATGRAEAMVDPGTAVWDLAPMPLIISEAGGRFTGLDGGEGIHGGSAVASNGLVHDALLGHLSATGARPIR